MWTAAVGRVRDAGRTWAPFSRLAMASANDFDVMRRHHRGAGGGYAGFADFCDWVHSGEQAAGTPIGVELLDAAAAALGGGASGGGGGGAASCGGGSGSAVATAVVPVITPCQIRRGIREMQHYIS